jgi:hypothetical protein
VISLRTPIALASLLVLAACGGGGGGSTSVPAGSVPSAVPTSVPTGLVQPTFHLTIPVSGSASKRRSPKFISSSMQSISILLKDVNGSPVGALANNPATTPENSTTCGSGCTVLGPPSPPGSDTFAITTYDGGSNALDTATGTYTLTVGITNSESIVLEGIPASFSIGNVPAPSAGGVLSSTIGGPANAGIEVSVFDADGNTITGTYANPVTVSDSDTNPDGSSFQTSACPGTYPVGNQPVASATSATLTGDTSSANFCYGGIAENPPTLSASASGATSGTAIFQPVLAVPVELAGSATPTGVAFDSDGNGRGDIALFATTGSGSTGSVTYTEVGWTNYPYEQALDGFANLACSSGSSFSDYATGPGGTPNGSSGTVFTVNAIGSPTPGACPLTISDALLSNSTDSNGLGDGVPLVELDSSYTSSSFSVNAHKRK